MEKKHILIICGEPSGDLQAANLLKELLKINPDIEFSGVGGELLRQAGAQTYADIKELAVIGFFDTLKKLPKFFRLKKLLLQKVKTNRPDLIILVDFSGFNLRFAKALNHQVPIIYYISPQVWASRPGRINSIKKYINKMLVFFKFEQEFYQKEDIAVEFVGHPLLDIVSPLIEKEEFLRQLQLDAKKTTIALLPGSRKEEVKNILPLMLKTATLIEKKKPATQFVVAKSLQVEPSTYEDIISDCNLDLRMIEAKTYDCLEIADFCLVASGTATLETALMQKPFFIFYKMGLLNYLLYRPQVKLPFVGLVNIIAGRKIIPEFIQWQIKPQKIAEETLEILANPARLEQMKAGLLRVKSQLGEKGASRRAAESILNFLNRH